MELTNNKLDAMLRRFGHRRFSLSALSVVAVALVALLLACGDDNGGVDGTETPSVTPGATNGTATPAPTASTQTPGVNCEEGAGPPALGEGPDDLVGTITYVRLVFGCSPDIYIMDASGDNARALIDDPGLDDESDLSPDGTTVVFFSNRTGNARIYTVRTDGSDLRELVTGGTTSPRWSPAGSEIAFSRGGDVMVMNADGSDVRTVMQAVSPSAVEPCRIGAIVGDWSPDGERVLYYSAINTGGTGTFWICAVNVESGDVEVLVSEPEGGLHSEPHWSPDGTKIAFRDDRETLEGCDGGGSCNYEIFVLDLETGEETNLTNDPGFDIEPVWSPDGEWILFASNRDDPNFDLYIMRPDGSDVQRVLNDPESKDSYPSWR